MTPETIMTIGQQAMQTALILAGPMLIAALIVGLMVGVFQAATQINEMTLSFIPKLGIIIVVMMTLGHWMIQTMMDFTKNLYGSIPFLIG